MFSLVSCSLLRQIFNCLQFLLPRNTNRATNVYDVTGISVGRSKVPPKRKAAAQRRKAIYRLVLPRPLSPSHIPWGEIYSNREFAPDPVFSYFPSISVHTMLRTWFSTNRRPVTTLLKQRKYAFVTDLYEGI